VHLVVGTAGALQEEHWVKPPPEWSAARFANGDGHIVNYTDSFGFGRVDFYNGTHMRFAFRPLTGVLADEFWIVKDVPTTKVVD
jgi:hypothetical protein